MWNGYNASRLGEARIATKCPSASAWPLLAWAVLLGLSAKSLWQENADRRAAEAAGAFGVEGFLAVPVAGSDARAAPGTVKAILKPWCGCGSPLSAPRRP